MPTMRTWQYVVQADGAEPGWWTPFVERQLPVDTVDPLAAQLEHFCDVIAGSAQPIVTALDAMQSLLTVEAVRQSIATGHTVFLRDIAIH